MNSDVWMDISTHLNQLLLAVGRRLLSWLAKSAAGSAAATTAAVRGRFKLVPQDAGQRRAET